MIPTYSSWRLKYGFVKQVRIHSKQISFFILLSLSHQAVSHSFSCYFRSLDFEKHLNRNPSSFSHGFGWKCMSGSSSVCVSSSGNQVYSTDEKRRTGEDSWQLSQYNRQSISKSFDLSYHDSSRVYSTHSQRLSLSRVIVILFSSWSLPHSKDWSETSSRWVSLTNPRGVANSWLGFLSIEEKMQTIWWSASSPKKSCKFISCYSFRVKRMYQHPFPQAINCQSKGKTSAW